MQKDYHDFHTKMSFVKSLVRIAGLLILGFGSIGIAVIFLIVAEVIGIIEEL